MESHAVQEYMPYIIIFNFAIVASILIIFGLIVSRVKLKEVPGGIQNFAEFVLDWFVKQARDMNPKAVTVIAPFLACLFLFILLSNLLMILPLPIVKIPPTSYYSGPLALSLIAVSGIVVISGVFKGFFRAILHLIWPNPLQLISEFGHALSLSLRLFGNIGGEFIVLVLIMEIAPFGIPLIIHGLGLIPAFIQAFVFTLLTSSFMAGAVHAEKEGEEKQEKIRKPKTVGKKAMVEG